MSFLSAESFGPAPEMRVVRVDFLRSGNVVSPGSGAEISFAHPEPGRPISSVEIVRWLTALPLSLRFSCRAVDLSLVQAAAALLEALTEQARLNAAEPVRLLVRRSSDFSFWVPIDDRQAAEAGAALTAHILSAVESGRQPSRKTARLWRTLGQRFWNQTHAHLARAAAQLGVPFYRRDLDGLQMLQLGQGSSLRLCRETLTDQTALFARTAANKQGLHTLLRHRGVPLPAQRVVDTIGQALEAAEKIGWPVVLKPVSGGKGKGVWVGISGPEQLRRAWQQGGAEGSQLVQQMLSGSDHRLLVVNGRLLAAAQRQPAVLISDGERPLSEQIAAFNADPERGVAYERLRNRVPVDERLTPLLQEQGWSMQSVPPRGAPVQLSRTANISQGGSAIDCSDRIHPDNRRLAEDIALLIGADVLGLDFISGDLGVSWRQGGTWLLEANLSPGLRPHLVANPQTDLCQEIVRQWVGEGPRAGRIPTALITGSIGKTTTSRLLAHLLQCSGLRVGLTSSTGMELDGQDIVSGDLASGGSALHLLQDPRVEAMVAEIARGGLLKSGLGISDNDVSAILNIRDNHVGSEGIRSRADLASIKGLVARSGAAHLVLNADDPLVMAMAAERTPDSLTLVGEPPGSPSWQAHFQAGHAVASYKLERDGRIHLHHRGEELLSIGLHAIPASENGAVLAIAPAAAFAAAMAYRLGIKPAVILEGLRSYGHEAWHVRGRFETFIAEPYRIVITKAGSPEAMETLSFYAQATQPEPAGRRVLFCVEGDPQTDAVLRAIGAAAWGFDLVICASRDIRRGRTSADEVPRLLAEGARGRHDKAPITYEAGAESEAVQLLVELLQPGDFCVISNFNGLDTKDKLRSLLS